MKVMALALALSFSVCAPAIGQDTALRSQHEDAHAVVVRDSSLDLGHSRDAAVMLSRLRLAAARVCTVGEVSRPDAGLRRAIAACEADALHHAVEQMQAPEVTRLYLASAR